MKPITLFVFLLSIVVHTNSQPITKQLEDEVNSLMKDPQMNCASLGFYVREQNTGKVIFNKNGKIGMVPASSQKILTAVAALDILGSDFKYETDLSYAGKIENEILNGDVYLMGYGDPTLGSSRYDSTNSKLIMATWMNALAINNIKQINGKVICFDKNWESQTIPGGWVWDDIGNYYGAGASSLNWRENVYDIILQSGKKENDSVHIVSITPQLKDILLTNELITGKPGSGDNAFIYLAPNSQQGFIRGSIPPNQSAFKISGALPNPAMQLQNELTEELTKKGIFANNNLSNTNNNADLVLNNLHTHYSPTLDKIIYWFLRKSINLYGEALVKTIGFQKKNKGATSAGITVIKDFYKEKGMDPNAINILDGSGLSPSNRVTPEALVSTLTYATSRPWFNAFNNALPEFNGIKMKSGTMTGVKCFTGYTGKYSFAIMINNYNGTSSNIVAKMYKLLDILK